MNTIKTLRRFSYTLMALISFCSFQAHAAYLSGEINIFVEDHFKTQQSKTLYTLKSNQTTYTLQFPKERMKQDIKTGDIVSIEGDVQQQLNKNPIFKVNHIKMIKSFKPSTNQLTGSHHTLVMLVDFNDKKATNSTSIQEVTGHMYTDENSMRQNILDSSFSQTDFVPDTNSDGTPDVYTVHLNYDAGNACNYNQWANDAKAQAAVQGIDTTLYRHFMFVLPNNASCGWGGLGHLGCGNSCHTWIKWNAKIVYAHELGHNLGMHHSATDPDNNGSINSEYGDHSGIMGNGGYRQVNAPQRMKTGWYENHPENVKTLTQGKKIKIFSLDKAPSGTKKQVVKITKEGVNHAYYLSYRTDIGTFGMGSNYANKVNVHRYPGPGNRTLFIKALAKDDVFIAPWEGVKVKALKTTDNSARVKVSYLPKCAFQAMPCQMDANTSAENLDGKKNYLTVNVPEGSALLSVDTSETVESPDVKLYVRHNELPTRNMYDCRSQTAGGTQICSIENPQAGTWYIWIKSSQKHEGITVMNQIDTDNIKKS